MKAQYGILISCLLAAAPLWCRADIAVNSVITIKPGNPDAAADRLVKEAERLQGYFVTKSSNAVVLKIPNANADAMQKFVEATWLRGWCMPRITRRRT